MADPAEKNLVIQDAGLHQGTPEIIASRKERFEELGFGPDWIPFLLNAIEIGRAKDRKGNEHVYEHPLHWTTAKRMLDKGYTHDQVCKLVA